MAIRLSGINSGLDTDSIVQALVMNIKEKKNSSQKKQTKLEWTMDAWKGLNTKVYSLYTNVSKLKYQSAYNLNKTTVSDNTKASVTAGNNAVKGTQTLKIKQIAQSGYMTGGKLKTKASKSSTMASLGYVADSGGVGKFNVVKGNGETTEIGISATDSIDTVLTKLNDAGLNASFDTDNNRFFISSKTTGADSDFDLIATNSNGTKLLSSLGLSVSLGTTDNSGNVTLNANGENYQKYANYYKSGTDATKAELNSKAIAYKNNRDTSNELATQISNLTEGISYQKAYKDLNNFYSTKGVTPSDQFVNGMKATNDAIVDSSGNVYSATSDKDSNGNTIYASTTNDVTKYLTKDGNDYRITTKDITGYKTADGTDATRIDDNNYSVTKDGNTITYTKTADGKFVNSDGAELIPQYTYNVGSVDGSVKTVEQIKDGFTQDEIAAFVSDHNTVSNFEKLATSESSSERAANNSKFEIMTAVQNSVAFDFASKINTASSAKATADNSLEEDKLLAGLADKVGSMEYAAELDSMTSMVVNAKAALDNISSADNSTAVKVKGQNAIIYLNGAEFESSTNSITVNGLTINAKASTGDEEITITTDTDKQGIYDKIKEFLTEYNNVINEMCSLYNAESAKGYEPLTDEEKDEMSDGEIEKWEKKIKDSLLKNDSTLNGIMDVMTTTMFQSYEVNGRKYSLSSFGISTLGYMNSAKNEHYAYHIDGDEDDQNTSDKDDKLMKAISEDPDAVISFMKQLSSKLYSEIGNKMTRTKLSSSYTIYNDKQMSSQYSEYSKLIKKWENTLSEKEEYYYKKFTAMEKALASINSTQSSLGSYFG